MAANFKMTLTMLFAASSYPLRHDVLSESSDDEADFKTRTLTRADWVAHSINMSEPATLTNRPIIPFKTGIMGKKFREDARGTLRIRNIRAYKVCPDPSSPVLGYKEQINKQTDRQTDTFSRLYTCI